MEVLYLVSIVIGLSGQNVMKKAYTKKVGGGGSFIFSALVSFFAMLFFVFSADGFSFNAEILPYSLGFAVSYGLANVFGVLAVSLGSLSLTSLINSFSLMLPSFYGLIFLHEDVGNFFYIGIFLLAVSLFLINMRGGREKVSIKWLICVFISFLGNGACSIVQNMQQRASGGAYKNEFMISALAIVTVLVFCMGLICERSEVKKCLAGGTIYGAVAGIFNGMVNLFVMILSNGRIPVSVMFPLISAGSIVATFFVSRFFYKEKLSKKQLVGFFIGVASIVFLNI